MELFLNINITMIVPFSSYNTLTHLSCAVNNMAVDDLVTLGVLALDTME